MSVQPESIYTIDQSPTASAENLMISVSQEVFVNIIRERDPQETLESYFENVMIDDFSADIAKLAMYYQMTPTEAVTLLQAEINGLTHQSLKGFELNRELLIAKEAIGRMQKQHEAGVALNTQLMQLMQVISASSKSQQDYIESLQGRINLIQEAQKEMRELRDKVETLEYQIKQQPSVFTQYAAILSPAIILASGYIVDFTAKGGWNNLTNIFTNTTFSFGW